MRPEDIIDEINSRHNNLDIDIKLYKKELELTNNLLTQINRFVEVKETEFKQDYNRYSDLFKIDIDLLRAYDTNSKLVSEVTHAVKDLLRNIDNLLAKINKIIEKYMELSKYEAQQLKVVKGEIISMREKWRTAEEMLQEFITLEEEKKKEIESRPVEVTVPTTHKIDVEEALEEEEDFALDIGEEELDKEDIEELEKLMRGN